MNTKSDQSNTSELYEIEFTSLQATKFGKQSDLKLHIEDFPDFETDTSSANKDLDRHHYLKELIKELTVESNSKLHFHNEKTF
jgi:hypothetical protein